MDRLVESVGRRRVLNLVFKTCRKQELDQLKKRIENSERNIANRGSRLVLAVVVSTLSIVPTYFMLVVLDGDFNNDFLLPVLLMTPIFVFEGVFFVGLPVHFFLVWKNWLRPVHYVVPGFLIPTLIVAVSHPFGEDGVLWISWQAILMGATGAIVALIFRRVALGKNAAATDPKLTE
jgi:hypothetical protein